MIRHTHLTRLVASTIMSALLLGGTAASSSATEPEPEYREGTLATAIANFLHDPDALPGGNDWSCKPSAEHPEPVILLPGSLANIGANFVKLAPRLKNAGYCVFGLNYGFSAVSLDRLSGLDRAERSMEQLSDFVDRVRQTTGATKVDLVGHSQGGQLAFSYIKLDDGAAVVDDYVSWGGTQNGTTLSGLATLGNALRLTGFVELVGSFIQAPGMTDQAVGSAFQKKLWADPTVPAGPTYTTIASRRDTVSTPYTNQALPGANNIVIQDRCPWNRVSHVGMAFDEPTLQLTMNALADGPETFQPACR